MRTVEYAKSGGVVPFELVSGAGDNFSVVHMVYLACILEVSNLQMDIGF